MAKPVSEEELQLRKRARRRLIGAIVLVAVVAVVLPMVLDSEPKPTSQEINIQIPSPDSKGFSSKVVPLPEPAAKSADGKREAQVSDKPAAQATDKPAAQATNKPAAKAPTTVEKPVAKAAEPAKDALVAEKAAPKAVAEKVAKAAAKAPEKATEKATEKAPAPKPGTFFIQVTALADADKAKQVRQQIIDVGLPTYTEVVAAGKGNVTRVRAGPFATREEADKAREKLQGAGLEGKVAAH